jgi:hypothetical protein
MPWIALTLLVISALAGATDFQTRRLEARFPPIGGFADHAKNEHIVQLIDDFSRSVAR